MPTINLTTRTSTETTGGTPNTIAGEGTIDNPAEATAALDILPSGGTIVVGDQTYNQARLEAIRDGQADPGNPAADPTPEPAPTSTIGHQIRVEGGGHAGGDDAHTGGQFRATYSPSIQLTQTNGGHRLYLDPELSFVWRPDQGMEFTTPGGESGASAFSAYGGGVGVSLRYNPPWAQSRFSLAGGLRLDFMGFGTPDSTMRSVDAGTGECSPELWQLCESPAGPRSSNTGLTGLYNPDSGNARGTGGLALAVGIPLTLRGDIARWDGGTFGAFFTYAPTHTTLFANNGPNSSFWSHSVGGGLLVEFGGSSAPARRTEAPTVPVSTGPVVTTETRTRGDAIQIAAPDGGWQASDEVYITAPGGTAALVPNSPTSGSDPFAIPAELFTADGAYAIEIRRGGSAIRTLNLTLNAPAEATTRVEISGVILEPVASVTGTTGSDLTVGSILTDRDMINVRLTYADGSQEVKHLMRPSGSSGQVTHPIVVPSGKLGAEGARSVIVQVVEVPTLIRQISYSVRPATNFAAEPSMDRTPYSSRRSDTPSLTVNAVAAVHEATITVNGAPLHGFAGHLNAGVNTFPITHTNIGSFTNNTRGATAGTYPVVITMPGGESRTVNLVIERPAGGGGGGGGTTTRPPRL